MLLSSEVDMKSDFVNVNTASIKPYPVSRPSSANAFDGNGPILLRERSRTVLPYEKLIFRFGNNLPRWVDSSQKREGRTELWYLK